MSGPEVSVVVPSWGAPPTLPALLAGLNRQTLAPGRFEILIVDAGADGGMRRLEELTRGWDGAALRLVRGPLPGGPAARRNRGAAEARGALLAFTDADCAADPGWLEAGLHAAAEGAQLVQGATLAPEGAEISPFDHHQVLLRETGLFESCNVFYESGLFERLGGFPTRYFRRYLAPFGEDAELGWRARRVGARFRFDARAVVRHAVTPRGARAQLRYMWLARAFPQLVREVPELRDAFLYRRWFLSRRSATFAAAAAGLALSRRVPPAAALALPYARTLAGELPSEGPVRYAALRAASDATLLAALLSGSARWRSLVL
jgi:glycosyltransferase involved in cell wall biosynthesis